MMLKKLRDRFESMRAIADLSTRAEAIARRWGVVEPAAEHFLLAALEMPDNSAAQALSALGHDQASLEDAIREQHSATLAIAGISQEHVVEGEFIGGPTDTGLYRAAATGKQLMQILSRQARERNSGGFRSLQVLEAALAMRHGVVPRVLKKLGVEDQLVKNSKSVV